MLRPLDPIRWTLPVLLARARTVTRRGGHLTLRQALRVLATYGRRRVRQAVDRMRWRYVTKSMETMIGHAISLRGLRRGWNTLEEALDWVRGPHVSVERSINRRLVDRDLHVRIVTANPGNQLTVELGVLGNGRVMVVMYPLRRDTHLHFLGANNERVGYPPAYPVMVKIELDAARRDHLATALLVKDRMRVARGRREHTLHTACDANGPALKVILRNLLNLGEAGEREEPLTPA